MKKLGPGCNEALWKLELTCLGNPNSNSIVERGCGAPLEITRDDLYTVDIYGPPHVVSVRFTCVCGVENTPPHPELFNGLPPKQAWLQQHMR